MPSTAFGQGQHAALSVLTGAYRLSKGQVAQLRSDLLGLSMSVGMISKSERITTAVLEQPVTELAEQVKTAEAANIDETGWREARLSGTRAVPLTDTAVIDGCLGTTASVRADGLLQSPWPLSRPTSTIPAAQPRRCCDNAGTRRS